MIHSQIPLAQEIQFLETERLLIRVSPEGCYKYAFETKSDDELKALYGIVSDETLAINKAKIAGGLTTYRTSVVFFHLIHKESNAVIGDFAFHNWYPMHKRSEIGYALTAESLKNKGYMKEAVPAILNFGFETMDINRMEALIHPDNIPSNRLVQGNGFEREGLLPQRYIYDECYSDALMYSRLRTAFGHK